jgi:hypothetical protein
MTAWSAAWSAARDAEVEEQIKTLCEMLEEEE